MKKNVLCIILIVGILVALLSLGFTIYIVQKPDDITLTVEPVEQVNYNNYLNDNQLDFKGNHFAWLNRSVFNSQLTLLTNNGEVSNISGVSAPFQLLKDRIVFIKNRTLQSHMINSQDNQMLAENVSSFIALPDIVLYQSDGHLYRYDWDGGKSLLLYENVQQFYIHQDQVYVIDSSFRLVRQNTDGTWTELVTLSVNALPVRFLQQGDFVVYNEINRLVFVDITTGATEVVQLVDGGYANNRMNFICDDARLFVSFQATTTDGSLVTDIDHVNNGLWSINPQTKEKTKLCEDVFEQLYLFEGNHLFGVRNNDLFQIDINTGAVTKVSK